ncbi:uncharacterized protein LOC117889974 isoform X4 [Drosophila subobscura]|uniref:uncharacterized protein LOC117889974 isoform X4 n=1 Tax=Drosophila subobscura TaxID=7241 RepID=UPI00155B36FC|nr:uncharacterized protein LOC117889974 isoform X4 [Drosophila subobscura]
MEAGPVIAFFILLAIGFVAYAVLQCAVICIAKRFCSARVRSGSSSRIEGMAMSSAPYRQGNALNASEERPHNRYGDIFFIEPSSEESARIRSQLEKDDKELPSYDEVMRMCNLTTPTAAAAASHSPSAVPSPIGIAALPAPPYSESDPHADAAAVAVSVSVAATPLTVITMEPEPSTSRAAQSPTTTTTTLVRGAPLTLPNTASNTEV